MKINVGDYVRTKTGIHKVFEINEKATVWNYLCDKKPTGEWDGSYEYTTTRDENIIKSSPNIIDLIEVGDIIAYEIKTPLETSGILKGITDISDNEMLEKIKKDKNYHIKSIVTKEQFEEMQYIVKED